MDPPHDLEVEVPPSDLEGAARGFPELRTLTGETLAKGEFTQWLEGGRLHVRIRYDFSPTHWVEERSVIQQEPELVQEAWSWRETRDEQLQRRFEVDFLAGTALAEKREKGELRRWSARLDIEKGRTFAGSAFTLALKSIRERLERGEQIELRAIGFTPKPTIGTVVVSYAGLDQMAMSGRTLTGGHFVLHPKIPPIIRIFVKVPDTHLWLLTPAPAAFLRWEGPLAEIDDPIVRVDLLPGESSGKAIPTR